MSKRIGLHSDSMVLALAVWLCSLPLVLFIIVPRLGLAALLLFFTVLVICWSMCSWKAFQDRAR